MNLTPEQMAARRVVCAAIRSPRGGIITGPRHFDSTMHRAIDTAVYLADHTTGEGTVIENEWHRAEQGFIDQWGNFLTRREAWAIAAAQGQIIRWVGNQEAGNVEADEDLYSENLY